MNYFDFVLCEQANGKVYLFRAPAFSHLEYGDEVVLETCNGKQRGLVQSCITVSKDDEKEIDFIMKGTGAPQDVKKVLAKVSFKEFKYEEDEQ